MYPELTIFGTVVRTHVLFLSLAVVSAATVGALRVSHAERLTLGKVLVGIGVLAAVVFAGGRSHYVYNRWNLGYFQEHPLAVLRVWDGLHAPGALAALLVGGPLVAWCFRLRLGRVADQFAPACLVGIAVARVGCFLNGCCHGVLCRGRLCVSFPPASPAYRLHLRSGLVGVADWSADVHAFQLYLVLVCAVALVAFWFVARSARYDGEPALVAAATYLVGATAVETFRSGALPHAFGFWGFTQLQVLGAALAAAVVAVLVVMESRQRMTSRISLASQSRRLGSTEEIR